VPSPKVPKSLQPLLSLTSLPVAVSMGPVAGAGPTSVSLTAYSTDPQEQSNWCWAAVTQSVSRFYATAPVPQQCEIVARQLTPLDCCGADKTGPCNKAWNLDQPLKAAGHYNYRDDSTIPFTDVQTEVTGSRPVGVRIDWGDGTAHFVAIIGWSTATGTEWVDVGDPFSGFVQTPYQTLVSGYHGSAGSWANTYTTLASVATPMGGAQGVAATPAPYPVAP
jgi:Papain-like cysteine protease AvrRpt2